LSTFEVRPVVPHIIEASTIKMRPRRNEVAEALMLESDHE
jgi:hypothetical protein